MIATAQSQRTEDERRYLQERVATLGRSLLVLSLTGFSFLLVTVFSPGEGWSYLIFATPVIYAGLWRFCAQGSYSIGALRLITFGALLFGILADSVVGRLLLPEMLGLVSQTADAPLAVMGLSVSYMSMGTILGATFCVALRAAIVPSSRARTTVVTLLLGVPLVLITSFGAPPFEDPGFFMDQLKPGQKAKNLLSGAVWWGLATYVCGLITHVVHGLRKEVRDAKQLGQYRLEEKLGEGGMGEVHRASHALLRRPTAIKLLKGEHATETSLKRFEKEVQHTAKLNHDNIITIFDYGHTPQGVFYYAMELLDGMTLSEIVAASGPVSPARAVLILKQVASALVCAHGEGLIHRDIKPANIMVTLPHTYGGVDERVRLLDFGLVREIDMEGPSLSQTGTISGTPLYLAPESILSPGAVDARSDLYALGAVAYFLLTGQHVFEGNTAVEVCSHHLHSTPVPLAEKLGRPLPNELCDLVDSCLAKSSDDRPQSALAFQESLDALVLDERWTHREALQWWNRHREFVGSGRASGVDADGNDDEKSGPPLTLTIRKR